MTFEMSAKKLKNCKNQSHGGIDKCILFEALCFGRRMVQGFVTCFSYNVKFEAHVLNLFIYFF